MTSDPSTVEAQALVRQLLDTRSDAALAASGLLSVSMSVSSVAAQLEPLWDADDVQVLDTRVNGPRIDARLRAGDGRAWLIVLWATATQTPRVESVTVYLRPQRHGVAPPGLVIVLNGPSSVGKSTLMRAFADTATTPWAYVDEPFIGKLPDRYLAWPDTAGPVSDGFLAALAASVRVGNRLIVSAAGISQALFRDALVGVPALYVGLDAPLEVLVQRQCTQADKYGGLAEASIGIHDGWIYELRIDTKRTPPNAAAEMLHTLVAKFATSRN